MWEQELIRKVSQINQPLEYLAHYRLYKEQADKLKRFKWIPVVIEVTRVFTELNNLDSLELLKHQRLDIPEMMGLIKLRRTHKRQVE